MTTHLLYDLALFLPLTENKHRTTWGRLIGNVPRFRPPKCIATRAAYLKCRGGKLRRVCCRWTYNALFSIYVPCALDNGVPDLAQEDVSICLSHENRHPQRGHEDHGRDSSPARDQTRGRISAGHQRFPPPVRSRSGWAGVQRGLCVLPHSGSTPKQPPKTCPERVLSDNH